MERFDYPPGIYDSVELILYGHASRGQRAGSARPGRAGRAGGGRDRRSRTDAADKWCAGSARFAPASWSGSGHVSYPAGRKGNPVDLRIAIEGCRFWSPEDPFLYELEVATPGDVLRTRFGMRTFRLDPTIGPRRCSTASRIFSAARTCASCRFFEDPKRGNLPWREDWVRRLHRAVPRNALELDPLLHRLSAGKVVSDRGRRGADDPGRVSRLVCRLLAQLSQEPRSWSRNTPSGCASDGTIPAW